MADPGDISLVPPLGRRSGGVIIAPDGSEVRLLLTDEHGATRCSVVEVSIGPGAASRPVRHRTVEEAWYVVEGEGEVWRCPPDCSVEKASPARVSAGDALVIPTGWAFQFRALPEAGLRFICVTMPPWPGMDEAVEVVEGGPWPPTL